MAKSKHGPALFELYDKAQVRNQPRPAEESPPVGETPAAPSASALRQTVASLAKTISGWRGGQGSDESASSAPPLPPGPLVAVEGGRVRISLGARSGALAVFIVVLLGCGVFSSGRWLGYQVGLADGQDRERQEVQRLSNDQIAEARRSEPVSDLFDGIGQSPVSRSAEAKPVTPVLPKPVPPATPPPAAKSATWVKGATYIVVQEFRSDAGQDATRAQEYLAQQGIESAVVGSPQKGFRLIATPGFNMADASQKELGEKLKERIKNVGKQYYESGGRYKLEGYFRTLKSDSW